MSAKFGWCASGHCSLCPQHFVSQFGVTHECSCGCHDDETDGG